jgi:secretion/DNA translocation related TadE-like protein
MAGTILSVGVVACTATIAIGFVTVGAASAFSQRIAGVADAAALAAADAASGAVTGEPCSRAAEVASASGAVVISCELSALVATVTVSASFGHLPAVASARAGPAVS